MMQHVVVVVTITVATSCSAASRASSPTIAWLRSRSSAAVGSSTSRISGPVTSARAIPTRWRSLRRAGAAGGRPSSPCPPLPGGGGVARVAHPAEGQREPHLVHAGQRGHQVAALEDEPDPLAPDRGEPPTVEVGELEVGDPDRSARRVVSAPATASRLDFPEPDGPTTPTSPRRTSRSTWSRAVTTSSPSPSSKVTSRRGECGAHRVPPRAVSGSTRVIRSTAAPAPTMPSTIRDDGRAGDRSAASANGAKSWRSRPRRRPRCRPRRQRTRRAGSRTARGCRAGGSRYWRRAPAAPRARACAGW